MADPGVAMQKALFEALTSESPPLAVYDRVPQGGASYPYVVISGQQAVPDDPLASRRDERFYYLTVWSTYHGQKEVLEILARIDALLHHARLASDSGRWVRSYVTRRLISAEPDGETYQGSATVRALTEHAG